MIITSVIILLFALDLNSQTTLTTFYPEEPNQLDTILIITKYDLNNISCKNGLIDKKVSISDSSILILNSFCPNMNFSESCSLIDTTQILPLLKGIYSVNISTAKYGDCPVGNNYEIIKNSIKELKVRSICDSK